MNLKSLRPMKKSNWAAPCHGIPFLWMTRMGSARQTLATGVSSCQELRQRQGQGICCTTRVSLGGNENILECIGTMADIVWIGHKAVNCTLPVDCLWGMRLIFQLTLKNSVTVGKLMWSCSMKSWIPNGVARTGFSRVSFLWMCFICHLHQNGYKYRILSPPERDWCQTFWADQHKASTPVRQ